jgi:hypothetical protein
LSPSDYKNLIDSLKNIKNLLTIWNNYNFL